MMHKSIFRMLLIVVFAAVGLAQAQAALVQRTADSVQFDSLALALADSATVTGSELKLLADQVVSNVAVTKGVTIDLNAKALSSTGGPVTTNILNITGNTTVTLKNGNITGSNGVGVRVDGAHVYVTDLHVAGCVGPSFFMTDAPATGHAKLDLTNVTVDGTARSVGNFTFGTDNTLVEGLVSMAQDAGMTLNLTGCTLAGNTAQLTSGVYCTYTNNNWTANPPVVNVATAMVNGTVNIQNCTFQRLYSYGVYQIGGLGSVTVAGSTFTDCLKSVRVSGAATGATITNCQFRDNHPGDDPLTLTQPADPTGSVPTYTSTVSGCTFRNTVGLIDKAVIKYRGTASTLNVTNCTFDGVGGGAPATDPMAVVRIWQNSQMALNMTGCTFVNCEAVIRGGGFAPGDKYAEPLWNVSLTNCTVWGSYFGILMNCGNAQLVLDKCIIGNWNATGWGVKNNDENAAPNNHSTTTVSNSVFVNADLTTCYNKADTTVTPNIPATTANETAHVIKTIKAHVTGDPDSVFASIDPFSLDYLKLNEHGPAVNIDGAGDNAGSKGLGGLNAAPNWTYYQ